MTMSSGLFSVYKISGYAFSDLSIILLSFRLALGETQIVEDTKKFLEEEGIHLQVKIPFVFHSFPMCSVLSRLTVIIS